ncbi:unnamed protein product [Closterium sp. NIES-54]
MSLCPSSVPQRVVLPEPPASSLPRVRDLESDLARAASPTVTRLLATVVTGPHLESTTAFALVTELVDFAARSRLEYVTSHVTEFESVCLRPSGVSLPLAGDPDAIDIPTPLSYAEAIMGEYSSQWQTTMDAEMASWKSTSTYVNEVPPPGANIVDDMWIFRVKRLPGSRSAFKARYVARGFAQRDYELHSLDFSTAFLQGSLHEEIWLRRPPGFTGSFPLGTQWSLRRLVHGLCQAPQEWHDTLRTTLAALGFAPSSADPSLFLLTDTTLPPFYVLVYVDDLVFATADTEALALSTAHHHPDSVTHGAPSPSALRLPVLLATAHSSVYQPLALSSTFGRVYRAECCEAEIYAGAMAAQELRWLAYLLTDLGERPRSPPVMFVDSKAMLAFFHEQRLKHIALRYFLARELQQRRQLRLSYVASRANTADVFTKALGSGDHQHFCTAWACAHFA